MSPTGASECPRKRWHTRTGNWKTSQAKDINVLKWMGMFVVARLAARHGIRVRLQQAEFGGLTALVWLPDEILAYQGAAAPQGGPPRRGWTVSVTSGQGRVCVRRRPIRVTPPRIGGLPRRGQRSLRQGMKKQGTRRSAGGCYLRRVVGPAPHGQAAVRRQRFGQTSRLEPSDGPAPGCLMRWASTLASRASRPRSSAMRPPETSLEEPWSRANSRPKVVRAGPE